MKLTVTHTEIKDDLANRHRVLVSEIDIFNDLSSFSAPLPMDAGRLASLDTLMREMHSAFPNKINAIKAYRHLTGLGLFESKKAVEAAFDH